MLSAGASFSAALTEKGSVIAWGNLRVCCFVLFSLTRFRCISVRVDFLHSKTYSQGTSGCIENHGILQEMEKAPTVIVQYQHKVIVKVRGCLSYLCSLASCNMLCHAAINSFLFSRSQLVRIIWLCCQKMESC